ncbi:lachrymatory-factor synthase-like [Panicum miliaceum]|uniref:Lachrymatory-factor synthase-like n=1 Tax=Panicum miliaceum TaxID=4540 RepID=A0A3L6R795_PANMI|nr:lachrymatory-factor synthase-like [Panicum miliaceum]
METKEAAAAEQLQQQQQLEQEQEQWRGAVEAALPSTPASAAWPHIASFCALHRYLPGIDVCELAAGDDGQPGCVRYVASLAPAPAAGGAGREVASWAREELLEIDGGARRLAYAVVGSSMGFGRYVASMAVVADEDESAAAGCRLVWAFECDPVQGWSLDGLLGYLDGGVKAIAARIEEAEAAAAAGAPAGGDVVAAA